MSAAGPDATRFDSVRCVVFDFDGTLVDSNAVKRDAYFEVVAAVPGGAEAVRRTLRASPGADRTGVLTAVHASLDASRIPPVAEWVAAYSRLCEERVASCPVLPGALEALEALATTHPLYVDSATPTEALTRVVARRGWQRFFRGVLGGPASKHENLARIARREELGPHELLYVGDGPADRRAAERFGCTFVGFGSRAPELRDSRALSALAPLVAEIARRAGL